MIAARGGAQVDGAVDLIVTILSRATRATASAGAPRALATLQLALAERRSRAAAIHTAAARTGVVAGALDVAAALGAADAGAAGEPLRAAVVNAHVISTDIRGAGVPVIAVDVYEAGPVPVTAIDWRAELVLLATRVVRADLARASDAVVYRTANAVIAVGVDAAFTAAPVAAGLPGSAPLMVLAASG